MTLQPWSFSTLAVLILLLLVALPTGQADNNFDFMEILRQSSQIATAAEDNPAKNGALQAIGQAQRDVLWATVRALAAAGDVKGAVEFATTSLQADKDSALWRIARAQAEGGDVKGALQTATMIKKKETQAQTFRSIAV